jgi:hypothetical protein
MSISFTYPPVASIWVVTPHNLFLYSDPLLPCNPPSYWLRLFSSQTFSRINTPTFLKPSHSSYLSAYEDGTECSETSAYKIQKPGNYPEESKQQLDISLWMGHRRHKQPFPTLRPFLEAVPLINFNQFYKHLVMNPKRSKPPRLIVQTSLHRSVLIVKNRKELVAV